MGGAIILKGLDVAENEEGGKAVPQEAINVGGEQRVLNSHEFDCGLGVVLWGSGEQTAVKLEEAGNRQGSWGPQRRPMVSERQSIGPVRVGSGLRTARAWSSRLG